VAGTALVLQRERDRGPGPHRVWAERVDYEQRRAFRRTLRLVHLAAGVQLTKTGAHELAAHRAN
jgi:hypothetical protein